MPCSPSTSWKFGGSGDNSYDEYGDGALVTEPFEIDGDASFTFWLWIDAEVIDLEMRRPRGTDWNRRVLSI